MEKKKKSYISIFFTAIILYVINLIIFQPSIRRGGHGPSPIKACYSNLRVIQGAVEMYNMDTNETMTDLDMKLLIDGHYLKNEPRKPDEECNYYSNENLTKTGEICCVLHGGLITEANSEIARKREREEELKEKERELKKMDENLFIQTMRVLPSILYLLFALMS